MNALMYGLLARPRLVLATALLLALSGLFAWFTMPRQEDPTMPDRFGIIVTPYPGADAETVERLITDPLEEELVEVDEVKEVSSTSRTDVSVIRVEFEDTVTETKAGWDAVRRAMRAATAAFPEGALEPEITTKLVADQEAVLLAVTGSMDPRRLLTGARAVKRIMLGIPGVSQVKLTADPEEQVTVEYNDADAKRLGLSPMALAGALRARNSGLAGGLLFLDGRNASVKAQDDFRSLDDVQQTELLLPSGATVPLERIARVRMGPREPAESRMRYDGHAAVGISIVPKKNQDLVILGRRIRAQLREARTAAAPLQIHELSFQPDYVEHRLAKLGNSLLLGIFIVAAVLFLTMGFRLGLVVASVVPLVALSGLAIYAMGGGILHQVSVSALIIALGMLVDNAIVVAESIQMRIDERVPSWQAAADAVRELALPLIVATATTLAAFVPMYTSKGSTGDFTRALPQVIMLTLSISYLFAVLVTPVLGVAALRPSPHRHDRRFRRLAFGTARFAVHHPFWVVGAALAAVAVAASLTPFVELTFFPAAGRDQFVIEVFHPEGTHLDTTDRSSRKIERFLQADERVTGTAAFLGRSAPKFYYNLPSRPASPHFAQVVVRTRSRDDVPSLIADVERFAQRTMPEGDVIPRRLEQGPPLLAPIEIRLENEDLGRLAEGATSVMRILRSIPGTRDIRQNMGIGVPSVDLVVHDAAAARRGIERRDVALAVLEQTRGLPAGELRTGEEPVPILVRAQHGERLPAGKLPVIPVTSARGAFIPASQVSFTKLSWKPAAIHHRDLKRVVTIAAHLDPGIGYNRVLAAFEQRLAEHPLPAGLRLSHGGAAEGSGDANAALASSAPIGLLLLLFFLLLEFNSFRRVGLVLTTVPLAAVGVVPGLVLAQQPFGFMSLLGVIALIGVVVNNAIVLIDVVESGRQRGRSVKRAVQCAVQQRIRPILLTTATTVAGLLPLALSSSPLWPPLAWAMIAGLLASTPLTLLVVPALYTLLFGARPRLGRRPRSGAAGQVLTATVFTAACIPSPAAAAVPLTHVLERARSTPAVRARVAEADRAEASAAGEWRQAYLPAVGAELSTQGFDRQLSLETPVGSFPFGGQTINTLGVRIKQPILDASRLLFLGPAASLDAEAARLAAKRTAHLRAAEAGERFLDILSLDAAIRATDAFIAALEAQYQRIERLVAAGRSLKVDQLRVALALSNARQERRAFAARRVTARAALSRAVGAAEPIEPGAADLSLDLPPEPKAIQLATSRRADILALERQAEAQDQRRAGVWLELIPRIEARGAFIWSDGLPFDTNLYFEGTVAAVWAPFANGTRFARSTAEQAARTTLRANLLEAQRGAKVAVVQTFAELRTAKGEAQAATLAVSLAEETVRVERIRYEEGQLTVSELLEAEALLRQQRTRREVAALNTIRAHLRARVACGLL